MVSIRTVDLKAPVSDDQQLVVWKDLRADIGITGKGEVDDTVLTAMDLFGDRTAYYRCIIFCNGENLSDFFFHKFTALTGVL